MRQKAKIDYKARTLYIDDETYDHLIQICEKKKTSKSAMIRILIDETYDKINFNDK